MCLNFHITTAAWLAQVATCDDVTEFKPVTLPLDSNVPKSLSYLPHYILTNLTQFVTPLDIFQSAELLTVRFQSNKIFEISEFNIRYDFDNKDNYNNSYLHKFQESSKSETSVPCKAPISPYTFLEFSDFLWLLAYSGYTCIAFLYVTGCLTGIT